MQWRLKSPARDEIIIYTKLSYEEDPLMEMVDIEIKYKSRHRKSKHIHMDIHAAREHYLEMKDYGYEAQDEDKPDPKQEKKDALAHTAKDALAKAWQKEYDDALEYEKTRTPTKEELEVEKYKQELMKSLLNEYSSSEIWQESEDKYKKKYDKYRDVYNTRDMPGLGG